MRIYLLGFMGAGKTSLGNFVADKLNIPFIDTDTSIESQMNASISQIFEDVGEDEFRLMEARLLRTTSDMEKALIATGGGLPLYHNNMQWLLEHGVTMYLHWPDNKLLDAAVANRSSRPLLSNATDEEARVRAHELLHARKHVYEQSSMTIEMIGDFDEDARTLERACKYIW